MNIFDKTLLWIKQSFLDIVKYFWGRLIASMIVGLLVYAVMAILSSPMPWLFGLIIGIGNMIPTIGPLFMMIIGSIILVFIDPIHALYLIGATLLSQILDTFVFLPMITGKKTGIKPLLVILLMTIGAGAFGLVGVLFAIPLAIIVRVFFQVFFPKEINRTP